MRTWLIELLLDFQLPENNEENDESRSVTIRPMDDERFHERSSVVEAEDVEGPEVPRELKGMNGLDAYQVSCHVKPVEVIGRRTDGIVQHSLDIEMTINKLIPEDRIEGFEAYTPRRKWTADDAARVEVARPVAEEEAPPPPKEAVFGKPVRRYSPRLWAAVSREAEPSEAARRARLRLAANRH